MLVINTMRDTNVSLNMFLNLKKTHYDNTILFSTEFDILKTLHLLI